MFRLVAVGHLFHICLKAEKTSAILAVWSLFLTLAHNSRRTTCPSRVGSSFPEGIARLALEKTESVQGKIPENCKGYEGNKATQNTGLDVCGVKVGHSSTH